ncbi:putative phage-type endonuclease [Paraburkholderia sp. BL8N3]|nr:YqaJ viral recombinase family protein [Paraburkholderia sp. BL8N3]TCK36688.1 putative phage-type endonuclease [Paraburkholderia sp. BL8N3]
MTDRDQWLLARQAGVGGSDCAAALGLSKFKTKYQLWAEKSGHVAPDNLDDNERVHWGTLMESVIASEYARRENVRVRRRNAILRHERFPWMIASIDRQVEGKRCGVECKNVDSLIYRLADWGEPGTDEVPEPFLLQCLHYLIVTGFDEWHLAACVGGNTLKTYVIRRDPGLEEMVIEGEHAFWQLVEAGKPPEFDYEHPTTGALLARLHPGTDGSEIALDPSIEHWHRVKQEADALAKQYDATSSAARNHIAAKMGQAAIGRLPDGSEYRRKIVSRKGYAVEPCTYVDLRHAKAKE